MTISSNNLDLNNDTLYILSLLFMFADMNVRRRMYKYCYSKCRGSIDTLKTSQVNVCLGSRVFKLIQGPGSTGSSFDSRFAGVKKGKRTLDSLGYRFWMSKKNKLKEECLHEISHCCLHRSQVRVTNG